MFLLCTLDNSRKEDTDKEEEKMINRAQQSVPTLLSSTSNKDKGKKSFL